MTAHAADPLPSSRPPGEGPTSQSPAEQDVVLAAALGVAVRRRAASRFTSSCEVVFREVDGWPVGGGG
jgi:hypothetical protein